MKSFLSKPLPPALPWVVIGAAVSVSVALTVRIDIGCWALVFTLLAWWAWKQPVAGLLLFIVIAPLLPLIKITQTASLVTLMKDVIILTLCTKLFILPLVTKKLPYRRNVLVLPLVLLLLWTAVGVWRADSLVLGLLRARDIVLYAMLYLAVLYLPRRAGVERLGSRWFLASAAVVMVLAGFQWFAARDSAVLRFDPARAIWIPRVSSTLGHPSVFGQYLITAGTLLGAGVLALPRQPRRTTLLLAGLAATAGLLYLTYSRAVWIGAAGALLVMAAAFLARGGQKRRFVTGRTLVVGCVIAAAALTAVLVTPLGTFLRSAVDPAYASNAERLEFAARLIAPITNREAIIGRGLGDVVTQNFRRVDLSAAAVARGTDQAARLAKDQTLVDNQYLKTFIELGLVGIMIYGLLCYRVVRYSIRLIRTAASPQTIVIGLWSLGFGAAFVIQALFIDIWDIFPTNSAFWIIAALISKNSRT